MIDRYYPAKMLENAIEILRMVLFYSRLKFFRINNFFFEHAKKFLTISNNEIFYRINSYSRWKYYSNLCKKKEFELEKSCHIFEQTNDTYFQSLYILYSRRMEISREIRGVGDLFLMSRYLST